MSIHGLNQDGSSGPGVDMRSLEASAARIVAAVSGSEIRSSRRINRGVMTFKVLVETSRAERFVIRFYPPGRNAVVECEPDLWARCRALDLPVPRVMSDSRSGPPADLAYVAYRWIEGRMLSEVLQTLSSRMQAKVAQNLARCLVTLEGLAFDGYGELVSSLSARDASWPAFICTSLASGITAIRSHGFLDSRTVQELEAILQGAAYIVRTSESRLVWGDISFDNILVDDAGEIGGLVDFESCLSGDPLATLGYCMSLHWDQPFCSTLLRLWPSEDDERRNRLLLYAIVRGLRLARYAHQPLPTGHPRDSLTRIFPGLLPAVTELNRRLHSGKSP